MFHRTSIEACECRYDLYLKLRLDHKLERKRDDYNLGKAQQLLDSE